jgi:hypothetical protein
LPSSLAMKAMTLPALSTRMIPVLMATLAIEAPTASEAV